VIFDRNSSGIFVPREPEKSIDDIRREARQAFYANHCYCPLCGNDRITQTCVGFVSSDPAYYTDTNKAYCKCGWHGLVCDLVATKAEVI
jgi:hypothetical protein